MAGFNLKQGNIVFLRDPDTYASLRKWIPRQNEEMYYSNIFKLTKKLTFSKGNIFFKLNYSRLKINLFTKSLIEIT